MIKELQQVLDVYEIQMQEAIRMESYEGMRCLCIMLKDKLKEAYEKIDKMSGRCGMSDERRGQII